jgi:hypothetical protein
VDIDNVLLYRNEFFYRRLRFFILVQDAVHVKPYSNGAAALLVFVCSNTGAVAPSYVVD